MGLKKIEYKDQETVIMAENLNDIQDAILELEDGLFSIDNNKSGEVISITDAYKRSFRSFSIYGKTTQAGTPTPTAPVEIVSAGEHGAITTLIYGKNMVGLENGGYASASGIAYEMASYQRTTKFHLPKGTKVVWSDSNGTQPTDVLQWDKDGNYIGTYSYDNGGFEAASADAHWLAINYYLGNRKKLTWCQLEIGINATSYEKFTWPQNMVLADTLRAIAVTDAKLATYTNASGQMWCADEIDLDRGVRVQRVAKCVSTNSAGYYELGSYARVSLNFSNNYSISTPNGLCNIATMIGDYTLDSLHFYVQNTQAWVFVPINELATQDARGALAWLQEKGAEIYYILATPIETPLTDEEIAAYKALHTNKPNTTVLNDAGAYMELEYVMDAKKYIDSLVGSGGSSRLTNVTLKSSAWKTESDGLHSQVVTVAGVTEYSKVDLLPSVEQLAIFHNKDVTFVTENEDGVVTVYAIGDKPILDYTMQAQITEVVV